MTSHAPSPAVPFPAKHTLSGFGRGAWRNPAVILTAYIVFVVGLFAVAGHQYLQELRERAGLESARVYADVVDIAHDFYSDELVPRIQKLGAEFDPAYEKNADHLPFPGRFVQDISGLIGERHEGTTVNLFSQYPFPWRADRALTERQMETLERLMAGKEKTLIRFEQQGGTQVVRLSEAVVMKQSCIGCHNSTDYGVAVTWKVGDVRGVREVTVPLPSSVDLNMATYFVAAAYFVLSTGLGFLILQMLFHQVQRASREKDALVAELQFRNQRLVEESLQKSNFLANMSHELRTPLNAILGYAEVHDRRLFGESGAGRYHENNRHILKAAAHLKDLIGDLLDIARIESGAHELKEETVSLKSIFAEIKSLVAAECEHARFEYLETFQPGLPTLRADPRALKQILINLISNALRHSGGNQVMLKAEVCGVNVCISVTDNGCGIPSDHLSRLTRRFYRGAMTRDPGTGTGIGLWLVDALVQAHGGKLDIWSEEGKGAEFVIVFPGSRTVSTGG